jgi:membrane associated rhomboid family serine protease
MGFADRDYYRSARPRSEFGHFSTWSVTTWLIVVNVAVFFLDAIVHRATGDNYSLFELGSFRADSAIRHFQIWRFITFQFLHAGIYHILFNMIGLYVFGPIVESVLGARRFLAFYLLCGIAGAFSYIALGSHVTIPEVPGLVPMAEYEPGLVGASAGIFGLLIAAAVIAPNVQIIVFIITMSIRTAAIFAMLIAAYTVLTAGSNFGGEAAHLGGGVLGFILIKNIHWLNFVEPRRSSKMYIGPRRRRKAFQKDWTKDTDH